MFISDKERAIRRRKNQVARQQRKVNKGAPWRKRQREMLKSFIDEV